MQSYYNFDNAFIKKIKKNRLFTFGFFYRIYFYQCRRSDVNFLIFLEKLSGLLGTN